MNAINPAQTFLLEAEDLLVRIEELALELTAGDSSRDIVDPLFRAFHTLKGSGGMFGFEAVAAFTHHVETVLDKVREGVLPVSGELIDLILRSRDQIKLLLEMDRDGRESPEDTGAEIVAALDALGRDGAPPEVEFASPGSTVEPSPALMTTTAGVPQTFYIRFRPDPGLISSGTNPIALLNELRDLGECEIEADTSGIPELDLLLPDQCLLAWSIRLRTTRGLNSVKDVFIFVEDGSELKIEAVSEGGAMQSEHPAERAAARPGAQGPEKKKEQEKERTVPGRRQPAGRAVAPLIAASKPSNRNATVRVPSERLDRLVSLVGELVMNQSRLTQVASKSEASEFAAPVEELERLVAELRDNVLGIRMMPIGATFSRFKRLVHDLSKELGKDIDLALEGEETELDKTVLDQLGDPLVHLIRNSIDHGIELPEERQRAGKSVRGTVRLSAAHVGSNVIITITDDGRGLDPEAIRAKAVEKGLIAPDARLSDRDIHELIFRPGFSTAKEVTNISGRGVGMDVVKRQFETLRGQIALSSEPGKGTRLTLTLPLTLAIIDGLLVEIGRDQFIVPMSVVTENVELRRAERLRYNGRNAVAVRGELVPFVRLREAFSINGSEPDLEKIVIARHGEDRIGLVVDRVLGSHQTVIQPLGRFYRDIELLSGATIMGDGRVVLILDLGGLVRLAEKHRHSGTPTHPSTTHSPVNSML